MHIYEDIKEMLCKELEQIVKKGELSAGSLETVDKILNSIKNAHKILMYEEYEDDGYARADGMDDYSMRHRDSMGRYARREHPVYSSRGRRGGGYSYEDGKEDKIAMLKEVMNDANSDDERRIINRLIRKMETE